MDYITTKSLKINGESLAAGKIIIGVKKEKLDQLVRTGKAIKVYKEDIRFVAMKELIILGEKIMPGEEVTGLSENRLKALVSFRQIKEVPESEFLKDKLTFLKDIPEDADKPQKDINVEDDTDVLKEDKKVTVKKLKVPKKDKEGGD